MTRIGRRILTLIQPADILARFVPRSASEPSIIGEAPTVRMRSIASRFWPDARPFVPRFLLGLLFVVTLPVIETIEIWVFQLVVDQVLVPRDLGPLPLLASVFVLLTIASGVVSYLDSVVAASVGEGFALSVRTRLYAHLLTLSPDALDRGRLGDTIARLTGDVNAVERFIVEGVADAISAVTRLLLFAIALFILDPWLAAVSLVVAPLFWGAARTWSGVVKRVSREKRRRTGALTAMAEERLGQVALVHASDRAGDEVDRFDREGRAIRDASLAATRLRALLSPVVDILELVGALVVIGLGTVALADGRLTLGGLLVFLTYLTRMYGPIRSLGDLSVSLFSASAGAERIIELLEQDPAVRDRPGARRLGRAVGDLDVEHVSYRYDGSSRYALRDVSVHVKPGEVVGVVGPNGAGKSTLVKLLLRFDDPQEGRIRLDGHDLPSLMIASVRANVGALLQEALLLDASVDENIRYGRPGATVEEVERAAEEADAARFIRALPEGYATRLGQRGRRLSGGQRQRIGIARLNLRDTPVVVLDEPATSLDATGAGHVLEPLRRLLAGRSAIIISHDLSWVGSADRIVVLEEGRVTGEGSHEQLIARGGWYARAWRQRDVPAQGALRAAAT